jgi:hypothetical protein
MLKILVLSLVLLTSCSKNSPLDVEETHTLLTLDDSKPSTNVHNLVPNGGGYNTTDWIGDSAWITRTGASSINFQSIYWEKYYKHITSRSQFVLISPKLSAESAGWYTLMFKHENNVKTTVAVQYSEHCTFVVGMLEPTLKPVYTTLRFYSRKVLSIKWYNRPIEPGYLKLDEVTLIKTLRNDKDIF